MLAKLLLLFATIPTGQILLFLAREGCKGMGNFKRSLVDGVRGGGKVKYSLTYSSRKTVPRNILAIY